MRPHIRNERASRERFDHLSPAFERDSTMPFVAWCGREVQIVTDFVFLDASHALLSLRYSGDLGPCRACLREIHRVVARELGLDKTT